MKRSLNLACILIALALISGCRLIQVVDSGGQIVSSSGDYDCAEGSCIIEMSGNFNDTFTAVPDVGYMFTGWEQVCANKPLEPCVLNLTPAFTETEFEFSLIAHFEPVVGDIDESTLTTDVAARTGVIEQLTMGVYEVGSTNTAFSDELFAEGRDANDYLGGAIDGDERFYLDQILLYPEDTFTFNVQVPDDQTLYGSDVGEIMPYVGYVLYPTSSDNPRPDEQQAEQVFPHLQAPGQGPLFPDDTSTYPLIIYSHGLGDQGFNSLHFDQAVLLASHGYIVCVLFHGDFRYPEVSASASLSEWQGFGMRPLAVKTAIDELLADPEFGPRINQDQIGAVGGSWGGSTVMSLIGAEVIGPGPLSTRQTTIDNRLKAVVGQYSFMGPFFFGLNASGFSDAIVTPNMTVIGTADELTSVSGYQNHISKIGGVRYLVAIEGEMHDFTDDGLSDLRTWTKLFLDAYVKGDEQALVELQTAASASGGGVDSTY